MSAERSTAEPAVDLDRSYQLTYLVRGPEWAVCVPQGELEVLTDVMRRCSSYWNGVGTLLVPVRRDGRISRAIDVLLETRPVERFLVHEELSSGARDAVTARFRETSVFTTHFDDREVHPLVLVEVPDGPKPPLNVPVFPTKSMSLATLACWGTLLEEDLPYWHERFDVTYVEGEAARHAFIAGQIETGSTSPLLLTANRMALVHARNMADRNNLVVLQDLSFERLVWFWNFRSRALSVTGRTPVVGTPRALLRHPKNLGALRTWLAEPPGSDRTPNLHVDAVKADRDLTRNALSAIGIAEETAERDSIRHGRDVSQGDLTFRFAHRHIGERIVRGSRERSLTALRNPLELNLPAPPGVSLESGHHVRLTLDNLPRPLPLTRSAAERMVKNATAVDGLTIRFYAQSRFRFAVRFPTREQALTDWATDLRLVATPTQDSRYADALLDRLNRPEDLAALADPLAVKLLQALTPQSRPKLAQRLGNELGSSNLDEEQIAEHLRGVGLFLEIEALDSTALASQSDVSRKAVLAALQPLVASGFVVRGRVETCPTCNVREFLRLDELAETVACHACRSRYVLAVVGTGGNEPPTMYRLDGLMARAMDQDVLPVLLAYQPVRDRLASPNGVTSWQGVELASGTERVDIDLIAYNGDQLVFCECKANGATLEDRQLDRLISISETCGARPALACVHGGFTDEQRRHVEERSGFALTGAQLLAAS